MTAAPMYERRWECSLSCCNHTAANCGSCPSCVRVTSDDAPSCLACALLASQLAIYEQHLTTALTIAQRAASGWVPDVGDRIALRDAWKALAVLRKSVAEVARS